MVENFPEQPDQGLPLWFGQCAQPVQFALIVPAEQRLAWREHWVDRGLTGFLPTATPYVASKFAVLGLSENLQHELELAGEPIGVSILCRRPGERSPST